VGALVVRREEWGRGGEGRGRHGPTAVRGEVV
jgi:hypothetical protein